MANVIDRIDARIAGLLGFCAASHSRALCLIVILASLLAIPGLQSMPVTDRDEARYVQASKQMMETGDYIDIRNQDAPRWKKPVGIYWLQVTSAKILGDGVQSPIWAYRVPSALGIIFAAALAYWALLPLLGRSPALIGGLVVASTAGSGVEAHIAKTDAVLLACTVLAFGAFIRIYLNRAASFTRTHVLLWVGLGAGFLIKGPIILIPLTGAILWLMAIERSTAIWQALGPLKGLLIFAAIAAPWYIAIAIKTDGAFFAESLGKDLLGKVGETAEKHGGPPGYYLATVWVTFWPWMPLALLSVPIAWASRRSAEIKLLSGWIIPHWLLFALLSTKLPHYILPVLPAVAGIIGMGVAQANSKPLRGAATALFVLGGIGAGIFALGPLPLLQNELPAILVLMGVLILISLIAAAIALARGKSYAFAGLGVLTLLMMFPTLTMITAPRADRLFLSPRLAAIHEQFDACADQPLLSSGYQEMSLVFLTDTDTRFVSRDALAAHLKADPNARGFLRVSDQGAIEDLQQKSGHDLEIFANILGTNYNSGREVVIALVGRKDAPALESCATDAPRDVVMTAP